MEGFYRDGKGGATERPGDNESTVTWQGQPLPYLPFAYGEANSFGTGAADHVARYFGIELTSAYKRTSILSSLIILVSAYILCRNSAGV